MRRLSTIVAALLCIVPLGSAPVKAGSEEFLKLRDLAISCGYKQEFFDAVGLGHFSPDNKGRFLEYAAELGATEVQRESLSKAYELGRAEAQIGGVAPGFIDEEFIDEHREVFIRHANIHHFMCTDEFNEEISE